MNTLLRERIRNTIAFQMGLPFRARDVADELGVPRQTVANELNRMADLRGADLQDANLQGANLRWANLQDAKGIILLPVQDTRGFCFTHAIQTDSGWRIRAGCRDFSISEAKEHWGDGYTGDREQGDLYVYAVEWLERKLAREGEG